MVEHSLCTKNFTYFLAPAWQNGCAGWVYVNLTQAGVSGEEVANIEKMPPQDQAVGRPVGNCLNW